MANTSATYYGGGVGIGRSMVVELPLEKSIAPTFNLENAVCSHGLFMMAPNHWDSHSKTLHRPLRIQSDDDNTSSSLMVHISHPYETPHSLRLLVLGTHFLYPQQKESLMGQVKRMLRLTEEEERNVREFQEIYLNAKERGFGRLFRSPTLFEDMVKCILLCNCQWSRTLSMARSLCELQLELQQPLFSTEANSSTSFKSPTSKTEAFVPKTPAGKDLRRKNGVEKRIMNSAIVSTKVEAEIKDNASLITDSAEMSESQRIEEIPNLFSSYKEDNFEQLDRCLASSESFKFVSCLSADVQSSEAKDINSYSSIANFPSATELAGLDENVLAKRCNLGYRASRILNLARSVVDGRIQLRELEEACSSPNLSNYNKLAEKLKEINGFGPYTCANVLMCMGFYHVVPSDSETIRHIKQVHSRTASIQTIERDVEDIYGKYAPFQFLAYWSEVWSFYEERFGKLSEMPHSEYKLITAANLTPKRSRKNKRIKIL